MKTAAIPFAILLALAPLAAQQAPVFRTGANIVTLDVTAVDKDGKPVRGLKADDFVVSLEGQARVVQTVDFIEFSSGSSRAAAPGAASGAAAPTPSALNARRERRVVVFLFDDLSILPGQGKGLAAAALRTLEQFGPDDLAGVAVTSGMVKPVNPTQDRAAVRAALEAVRGRAENVAAPFFISARELEEIDRGVPQTTLAQVQRRECIEMDPRLEQCPQQVQIAAYAAASELKLRAAMQLEAYHQIVAAMKQYPGQRVLITLSDGVPTNMERELLTKRLDLIMRDAAENGVKFYALTEDPTYADVSVAGGQPQAKTSAGEVTRSQAVVEHGQVMFNGMAEVASAAGGEAYHVIGQGDRFFTRIEAQTSAIYRLAVDAPAGADTMRFLNAKISVKRAGVTVITNRKTLSPNAAAENFTVDNALRSALSIGGTDVSVPVTIATALRKNPAGAALQLGVNLHMPGTVSGPVATMFSLLDETGKSIQAGRRDLPPPPAGQDYRFAFALSLTTSGKYTLRIGAADATGRVGSAEQHVDATLARIGPFAASQLLIGWKGADNTQRLLALDTLPEDTSALQASVELYADDEAAMRSDVVMHFAITPIGTATPVIEKDLHPFANGLTLSAAFDFDAAVLKPGTYTVSAAVMQSGVSKGLVQTLIRKR